MSSQWKAFAAGTAFGVVIAVSIGAMGQERKTSDATLQQLRRISEVFGAIKANFAEPVEDAKLADGCIGGMVRKIDAGGDYLDREAFRELQVGAPGGLGGLGFEIGMLGDRIRIVTPIEGTPAQRAGIRPGDLLLKVDGTDTTGLSLTDVVKLLRGKPGSEVKLGLARDGSPIEMTLTRELIRINSVRSRLLEQGVGYVRISAFQEATPSALARALTDLRTENGAPLKGLVLDLRNNPGGLLTGGVAVAATFLQDNVTVVMLDGRNEDAKRRFTTNPLDFRGPTDFRARFPEEVRKVPLAVLVNGGSAAASEIVAGAMQDYKRATVIGTKTFGRGSIQTIMPMGDNTALKLTTAYWYLPGGRAIHGKGITPDVELEGDAGKLEPAGGFGTAEDPALQRALRALRK